MKNKRILISITSIILLIGGGILVLQQQKTTISSVATQTASVKPVSSEISADGTVTPQNQATLHFQTSGKLTYLPFKEGDTVSQGTTVARLDTYALEHNVELAANAYQTTKNTNDQNQENQQAGILEGQQRTTLDTANKNSYANSPLTESQVITDTVKRIVDNNQLAQNSAQLNVDLANYAMQLATLTSPLDGVITHEDVTVPYENVTPTTSFTISDLSSLVFRASISDNDIDYISEGSKATILLNGQTTTLAGTVVKVYPSKVSLPTGGQGYQVDISADGIKNAKIDQAGTVLIQSNTNADVLLIPSWIVLANKYVWVEDKGKPVMKTIVIGKMHGSYSEVLSGLSANDQVIINPEVVTKNTYSFL